MRITRTTVIRFFRALAFFAIGCVIAAYAVSRSLDYARGPTIVIFEPPNGSAIASTTAVIRGQAERVNRLAMNGQPILIDEQGGFTERILIFPGLNKLSLTAEDQFGRSIRLSLDLVGKVELPAMKAYFEDEGATTSRR